MAQLERGLGRVHSEQLLAGPELQIEPVLPHFSLRHDISSTHIIQALQGVSGEKPDYSSFFRIFEPLTPEQFAGKDPAIYPEITQPILVKAEKRAKKQARQYAITNLNHQVSQIFRESGSEEIDEKITEAHLAPENTITPEQKKQFVQLLLSSVAMDDTVGPDIQIEAVHAFDRISSTTEHSSHEPPAIADLSKPPKLEPTFRFWKVATIGSLAISALACRLPQDGIALFFKLAGINNPSSSAPIAPENTPTPSPTQAAQNETRVIPTKKPVETNQATPTQKPTESKAAPTATTKPTEQAPTPKPTETAPVPTVETIDAEFKEFCLKRESTNTFAKQIETWQKQGLSPKEMVKKLINEKWGNPFPSYLVYFPDNTDPKKGRVGSTTMGVIGMTDAEIRKYNKSEKWGLTDEQIQKCEEQSLLPYLSKNIGDPKYWPQAPGSMIYLNYAGDCKFESVPSLNATDMSDLGQYIK